MTIAFFTNYLNHHQMPLADAFSQISGIKYIFVVTSSVPEFRKKLGYKELNKEYVLDITKSDVNKEMAKHLAIEADVAIFLPALISKFGRERLKANKLTFEYSERWFKRDYKLNLLSPNLWKHQLFYYRYGKNANLYMLCSSAYAANDYYSMCSFVNKCFKWGYFPSVPNIDIDSLLIKKRKKKKKIMWCGRFIKWKHPEFAILLAKDLVKNGYDFEINMYGNGSLLEIYKEIIKKEKLEKYVMIKGNVSSEMISEELQEHNIFILTSDQNEGWGAVANEAMSNGCTVVGSSKAGSIPFLVKDMVNGMIFESKNIKSLCEKVKYILDNPEICERFAKNAYFLMRDVWSPNIVANRFVELVNSLNSDSNTPFEEGPCSIAIPTK